jgi:hypothetical protein
MVDQFNIPDNLNTMYKNNNVFNTENSYNNNTNEITSIYDRTKRKKSFNSNCTNSPQVSRKNSLSSESASEEISHRDSKIDSKMQANKCKYEKDSKERQNIIEEKYDDSPDSIHKPLVKENKPTLIFDILRRKSMQVKQIFKENQNESNSGSRRDSNKEYNKEITKRTKQCFSSKNVTTRPLVSINNSQSKDPYFLSNQSKVVEDSSSSKSDDNNYNNNINSSNKNNNYTNNNNFSSSNSVSCNKDDFISHKDSLVSEALKKISIKEVREDEERSDLTCSNSLSQITHSKNIQIKPCSNESSKEDMKNINKDFSNIQHKNYNNNKDNIIVNKNLTNQSIKISAKTNYSPINENTCYESGSEGFESC